VDIGKGWTVLTRILCVNLCVKKVPKLTKTCKIGKNMKIISLIVSVCYLNLRRLGSSETLSTNPYIAGSNPAGRARKYEGLQTYACSPFFASLLGVSKPLQSTISSQVI